MQNFNCKKKTVVYNMLFNNTGDSIASAKHPFILWEICICNVSSCHSHTQSDSYRTLSKQPSWETFEAVTSRTECQHHGGQKMCEQCQKWKTLESGCHDRRLGLCAVYLSLFLTAMFLSVLTPCQPHLARALWVAGRRQRWRYTKQAG